MITFSWFFFFFWGGGGGGGGVGGQENDKALFIFCYDVILFYYKLAFLFFLRIQYITHNSAATWEWIQLLFYTEYFICTGNINRTLSNKIVDHSDVVGASPVGAAPTTSPFST